MLPIREVTIIMSPLRGPTQNVKLGSTRTTATQRVGIAAVAAALALAGSTGVISSPAHATTSTGTIAGTVLGGEPQDALIKVYRTGYSGTACYLQCAQAAYASAASDGTYTVSGLQPGSYVVEAEESASDNVAPQWSAGQSSYETGNAVVVSAGQTVSGVDFKLSAGPSISGTLSAASGTDLADGVVATVYAKGGKLWHQLGTATMSEYRTYPADTVTSAPASYQLPSLPTGSYRVGFTDAATSGSLNISPGFVGGVPNAAGATSITPGAASSTSADATVSAPSSATIASVTRTSGSDRYQTAVAIAKSGYPHGAPVAFIATGTNYPDALAAGPAAAKLGGPLLLTDPSQLPPSVSDEVAALHPSSIYVVGGTAAVSDTVVSQLQSAAPSAAITRLAGADRFDTSRKVVEAAFPDPVPGAYVATGTNYPDALAAAAAAGAQNEPVILVNGSAGSTDQATLSLIGALGVTYINIAGGPNAVSTGIEQQLFAQLQASHPAVGYYSGAYVRRLGGADRFATAVAIAADGFSTDDSAYLATGYQFPDALAGSALAGSLGHPLFTVPSTCVPVGTLSELERLGITKLTLFGGANALSDSVAKLSTC